MKKCLVTILTLVVAVSLSVTALAGFGDKLKKAAGDAVSEKTGGASDNPVGSVADPWKGLTTSVKAYGANNEPFKYSKFSKYNTDLKKMLGKCYKKQESKNSAADGNYTAKTLTCGRWVPTKNNCRFVVLDCYSHDDSCKYNIKNTGGYKGQANCPPAL